MPSLASRDFSWVRRGSAPTWRTARATTGPAAWTIELVDDSGLDLAAGGLVEVLKA